MERKHGIGTLEQPKNGTGPAGGTNNMELVQCIDTTSGMGITGEAQKAEPNKWNPKRGTQQMEPNK